MAKKKASVKDLGETRRIAKPRFSSKPLRPESRRRKKEEKDEGYQKLVQSAKEEERRKSARRGEAQRNGQGAASGRPGGRKVLRMAKNGQSELSVAIVTAISVAVLILFLWLLSSFFLRSMSKRHGGIAVGNPAHQKQEAQSEKAEEAKKSEESSAESAESQAQASSEEKALPAPLTEGDAEFRVPESWVGKRFAVKDDANVRSGPGTANGVVGSVDPGEIIEVYKAESLDDATWLFGTITKRDGSKLEGWIYAYAVSPALQ